ncbi:MAG: sulfite exporter TauE/SafE family protein, partial [Polynucleobacter sp.]
MELITSTASIAISLGIGIGLIMAITGAGGGILSVPLLVFVLHLQMLEASPIGLLAVTVSSGVGALIALRAGHLRYRAAILLASAGLLLSPIGVWLAHQIPNQPLMIIFAAVLCYVAIRTWIDTYKNMRGIAIKSPKAVPCCLDLSIGRLIWTVPCARALIGSGAVAGFLSGLLGVGGGFVIVPALKKISDLPVHS